MDRLAWSDVRVPCVSRFGSSAGSTTRSRGYSGTFARCGSQLGRVPIPPVIEDGIFAPTPLRLLATDFLQVFRRIRVRPVLPPFDVAVTHRIVQDVVYSRPEVPLGFHGG